jgi:hypothetical protein
MDNAFFSLASDGVFGGWGFGFEGSGESAEHHHGVY